MTKLITIEGIEGMGKSTVIETICTTLNNANIEFILTREPGGTKIAEEIREIILNNHEEPLMPLAEALLFFASREQNITQKIKPALARGQWVVSDRFTDSSLAYQGAGRGVDMARLETLSSWVQAGCKPDLTLLLDAPVEVGLARIAERTSDRIEAESAVFFTRVRECYLKLAQSSPGRYRIIHADKPVEVVMADIQSVINEFIEAV